MIFEEEEAPSILAGCCRRILGRAAAAAGAPMSISQALRQLEDSPRRLLRATSNTLQPRLLSSFSTPASSAASRNDYGLLSSCYNYPLLQSLFYVLL